MELLRQFVAACMLLTRLPVSRLKLAMPRNHAAAVWAYPLVGALVGMIGAAMFCLTRFAGIAPLPAALLTITAQMLATGALHEDGLADLLDGFGGGADRQRKLAIMRDSNIGAYGALGLIVSTGIRVTSLAVAAHPVIWLIVIGAMSRSAMLGLLASTKPARRDGIAASLQNLPKLAAGAGLAIGVAAALISPQAILAVAVCVAITLWLRWLTLRQIDGQTGDVLGACAMLSESAIWMISTI